MNDSRPAFGWPANHDGAREKHIFYIGVESEKMPSSEFIKIEIMRTKYGNLTGVPNSHSTIYCNAEPKIK